MSNGLKESFAPVVDAHIQLLVLGSLPGERSLLHQQYYAHPQNRFWQLMSAVLENDLTSLPYSLRLQTLLSHKVGLWDVVAKASRQGSLDSRLRDIEQNNLGALLQALSCLRAIAFNGSTAARIGEKLLATLSSNAMLASDYQVLILPSSSPAYTLAYEKKLQAWVSLRPWIGNEGRCL